MVLLSELSVVRAAHIVLACTSPHRAGVLNEQVGTRARCVPPGPVAFDNSDVVAAATNKALNVFDKCDPPFQKRHGRPPSLIVGVDTVVSIGDQILGKPETVSEARAMVQQLVDAGSHKVTTGVALVYGNPSGGPVHTQTFVDETEVQLDSKAISDAEIEAYVASGEPMEHPGGYSVRGLGSAFAKGLVGDHMNAEYGFPLHKFLSELDSTRLQAWIDAAPAEPKMPPPEEELVANEPPTSPELDPAVQCEDEQCGLPSD